jgi:soluble lytic murein transglycosylase-like protein
VPRQRRFCAAAMTPLDGNPHSWLVRISGPSAGIRHPLSAEVIRVGRAPENDIIIEGGEAAVVSARHFEIHKEENSYRLLDLNSTNGTYVNGERVSEAVLEPPVSIRLGAQGPELSFVVEEPPAIDLNQTLVVPAGASAELAPKETPGVIISTEDEHLLTAAVREARMARVTGIGDQTLIIMRDVLRKALHRKSKRFKAVIAALVVALAGVSGYGYWRIAALKKEKGQLDGQMQAIEAMLRQGNQDSAERDRLIVQLSEYEDQARALQSNLLYRLSVRTREEFIKQEIRTLMSEFGAEVYSIPPEFAEQVNVFIQQYQGPDRTHMERALGEARKDLDTIREVFEEEHLPPDLGYMVLVESAFIAGQSSPAGAAGLWQFTPATARAYGLRVDGQLDERLNVRKASRAGCKYIRDLILDFGSGSSVMLALAAYNLGPGKVKQAVRKVQDPIKQRNFWYLYRVRALPAETRQYVPKVIAAMIVGRNPERFGF